MHAADFSAADSKARRDVELAALQTLIDGMTAVNRPIWMITLVTKQDLWFDQRLQVRDHYANGVYNKIIAKFSTAIGERNFQHEFLPVSLTLSSLATLDGKVFAPTCAGYDIPTHQRYLLSMFGKVGEMMEGGRRE